MDAASSTRQRFTDAQITRWINIAQEQAVGAGNCLIGSMNFELVVGTTYYDLPANFQNFSRVTLGNLYIQEMSPAALDGRSRGWETATGHPTYYFVNFSSRGKVGFAPFPGTTSDTDTVKLEYYIHPEELSNSTDEPFNGVNELDDFHSALPYYAASNMMLIDGLATQSQAYMAQFNAIVTQMAKECKSRPNYLPSAAASP